MTALSGSMEEQAQSAAPQQQLDAFNSKLLEQLEALTHDAQLFALQSLLTKAQDEQEF
jgi:hypothetical protein